VYASESCIFCQKNNLQENKFKDLSYYWFKNQSIAEPIMYTLSHCEDNLVKMKGIDVVLYHNEIAVFLIVSDIIIFSIFIIGFNTISRMSKDFVHEFNEKEMSIKNFTVIVSNLGDSFKSYRDETSLKRAIFN